MIGLNVLFWIMVVLFAIIGMSRGWAKELLVSFSVILALFIIDVLVAYAPFMKSLITGDSRTLFWVETIIVVVLVFFGYQGPNLSRLAGSGRFARERLQDSLLGFFLGAINGYLVWGTIWYFLNQADYPFPGVFLSTNVDPAIETAISRMVVLMPPAWLNIPVIYFAVAVAFAFVLVVFL